MIKGTHAALLAVALASCTHDLSRTLPPTPSAGNEDAKNRLAGGDFDGARSGYGDVLTIAPGDAEAALGWVIADLLALPRSAPVAAFLLRMNQPSFDLEHTVFGPTGYLAEARAATGGTASVTVLKDGNDATLETVGIRSQFTTLVVNGSTQRSLFVSLRQRTGDKIRFIGLDINLDDPITVSGPHAPMPLTAGMSVDAAKLNGSISIYEPTNGGEGSVSVMGGPGASPPVRTGTIEFMTVPSATDASFAFTFHDVKADGYTLDGAVAGRVVDVPAFDTSTLPFGAEAKNARTVWNWAASALLRASPVDAAFIEAQLRALGDHLHNEDGARLQIVLAGAGRDTFSFVVPKDLFHVPHDIHLSITDVRLLAGLVELAAAGLELSAQYRSLDGNLGDLVTGSDFVVGRVQPNLSANLLARADGFDLSAVKARLDAGLSAAHDAFALQPAPGTQGLFAFQQPSSKRMFDDVAQMIDAVRRSITADQPVPIPAAPLFQADLRAFFDQPLDRQRLLMLTGLTELVRLAAGSPDRMEFAAQPFVDQPERSTGGVLRFPPSQNMACSTAADCGAGAYVCNGRGRCESDVPYMFSSMAMSAALTDDWPAWIDPVLRDVFDLDLF